jgi:hypothetical protein
MSSPELSLPGYSGHRGSPRWLQHEEGQAGILTTSFNSSKAMRIGLTTMDRSGGGLELDEWQHEV